jgi:hypothetical protein
MVRSLAGRPRVLPGAALLPFFTAAKVVRAVQAVKLAAGTAVGGNENRC